MLIATLLKVPQPSLPQPISVSNSCACLQDFGQVQLSQKQHMQARIQAGVLLCMLWRDKLAMQHSRVPGLRHTYLLSVQVCCDTVRLCLADMQLCLHICLECCKQNAICTTGSEPEKLLFFVIPRDLSLGLHACKSEGKARAAVHCMHRSAQLPRQRLSVP